MPRPSNIEKLPEDILDKLRQLLADPRITQMEATERINAILAESGEEDRISKSALNRYAQRMEEVGRKLKEKHEVSKMWIGKFGRLPQGQLGQLIIQMVHGLAFDASVKLSEQDLEAEDMPAMVKMLKDLSTAMERAERATSINADREKSIRKEIAAQAAETVQKSAASTGLNQSTIDQIKKDILGIA